MKARDLKSALDELVEALQQASGSSRKPTLSTVLKVLGSMENAKLEDLIKRIRSSGIPQSGSKKSLNEALVREYVDALEEAIDHPERQSELLRSMDQDKQIKTAEMQEIAFRFAGEPRLRKSKREAFKAVVEKYSSRAVSAVASQAARKAKPY